MRNFSPTSFGVIFQELCVLRTLKIKPIILCLFLPFYPASFVSGTKQKRYTFSQLKFLFFFLYEYWLLLLSKIILCGFNKCQDSAPAFLFRELFKIQLE